jgi:hypothetical protein
MRIPGAKEMPEKRLVNKVLPIALLALAPILLPIAAHVGGVDL